MRSESDKIIEVAKELLRQYGFCVEQLWHVDDVHFVCEQNNLPKISDEEAMEVFAIAKAQFDGECGISWPQLEKAVQVFVKQKSLVEDPCENVCDGACA